MERRMETQGRKTNRQMQRGRKISSVAEEEGLEKRGEFEACIYFLVWRLKRFIQERQPQHAVGQQGNAALTASMRQR